MFRRIERVVADLLARGNVVTPVDVLIGMGLLRLDHLSDWRCGRVPYLERVIECNLMRLSRLLRILRFHAHDLDLKPSATVYNRYGKGPKRRLRFSKSGDARLEAAYATHFVWPGQRPFHPRTPGNHANARLDARGRNTLVRTTAAVGAALWGQTAENGQPTDHK
jgi:hypothetical protein